MPVTDDFPVSAHLDALDHAPIRPLQLRTFLLCAMAAMLNGFDNQMMGVVAPLMSRDLGLGQARIGAIFSMTEVGAIVGALLFGPVADRFGRKPAIIAGILVITAFTWATTSTPAFGMLLWVRFLAGVGLAGVFSSALALTSEYAPGRLRGTMVALTYAGYPAGAAAGGVVAAAILAHYGWRSVLYIGVTLGATLALLSILWLPESVRFLLAKGRQGARVDRLLAGLGLDPRAVVAARDRSEGRQAHGVSIWSVFRHGLARLTVLLCLWNVFVAATIKVMVAWLPGILTHNGFTVSQAALAQAAFNVGGIVPMIVAGWLIDRVGPFRVVVPAMLLGAVSLVGLSLARSAFGETLLAATLVGVCIGIAAGGGQIMAARLFPVSMRATGMGWGIASARGGSVISPMIVALVLAQGVSSASVFLGLALAPVLAALAATAFIIVGRNSEEIPVPARAAAHGAGARGGVS